MSSPAGVPERLNSQSNSSSTEKTWEIAIVVVFVLVVSTVIGALLFVRRRRRRADQSRQTIQRDLERRSRTHFYSTELSVIAPELSKPTPAVSSKSPAPHAVDFSEKRPWSESV